MNMLFHKMRTGKKGQVVAVLTVTLVIFIIAAFIMVNSGKNILQKTRVKNAAQAGVLAGGSVACVLLNSMANLNDNMILNFAGFTLQVQMMLVSWMIDYVKTIVQAALTLVPFNFYSCTNTILAVITLCLTTSTLALLISGATKISKALIKMINELNDRLPKNSRDSARQYALANAGVDAPRTPFSKSGAADARAYSLIESKFDEFMRLLPAKNKADTNYGTSVLNFDWDDSRTGHIVNNRVAVTVTPVLKVPFRVIKFKEVDGYSSQINAYLSDPKVDVGWLKPVIKFGVSNAGLVLTLLNSVKWLIIALAVYLMIIDAILWVIAVAMDAVSWFFCITCALAVYYHSAAGSVLAAAIIASVAATAFMIIWNGNPAGDVPCFVWDINNPSNSYPLSVTVTRTTNPSSIDYGIYKTNWPALSSTASGVVKGYKAAIFPPKQNFDITPNF
jgi:hypothetical protein